MTRAIHQSTISRRREEVRDDRREQEDRCRDKTGSAGDNCHTLSNREESESLDERVLWHATDDKAAYQATNGLRGQKEIAACDIIEKVLQEK